jgi:hypothetical protein
VVVAGRGSKLVGSTLRDEVTREELARVLFDGFFPVAGSCSGAASAVDCASKAGEKHSTRASNTSLNMAHLNAKAFKQSQPALGRKAG